MATDEEGRWASRWTGTRWIKVGHVCAAWLQTTLGEGHGARASVTTCSRACVPLRLPSTVCKWLQTSMRDEELRASVCSSWPMLVMRRLSLFNRNKIYANRMRDNGKVIRCVWEVSVWQILVFVSTFNTIAAIAYAGYALGGNEYFFHNLLRTSSSDEA